MKVILASKSPRRYELLNRLVKDFKVVDSNFDEDSIVYNGDPEEYVKTLSKCKALKVAKLAGNESIIIAADTIVFHNGKVLEKPRNREEAYSMLCSLSGNTHKVYSGICIINTSNNDVECDACCTEVKFAHLIDNQIISYINSGEPLDKAGAYGIQGLGGVFVEEIKGCYYNVMGLPLNKVHKRLSSYNITLL